MTLRVQFQTEDGNAHERQMSGVPRVDEEVAIGDVSHTVQAVEWQADAFREGGPDVLVVLV